MRQPGRPRSADPRRCRLAQFAAGRVVPENIVLLPLPPYAPELNPAENIWEYLRGNALSNGVWETYEAILDACCGAWNALMAKSNVITSIGTREWAQVRI
jgi:transposase